MHGSEGGQWQCMIPAGDRAANIAVILFPPKLSCNTLVSLLFRYGINTPFFPFACATNALITFPNSDRLLLILAPSFKVAPEAPVLF